MKKLFALGVMIALLPTASFAEIFGNPDSGQILFGERCAACHSAFRNMTGPRLSGIIDRRAGTVSGYRYSQALQDSGLRWNKDNLDRYLTNPSALVPGTKMVYSIENPQERADLVSYIKTFPTLKK